MNPKNYHLYIYHPDKNGWEKYEFVETVLVEDPKAFSCKLYNNLFMKQPKGVNSFEAKLIIHDRVYSSLTSAYGSGGNEIVLAERMIKQ